MTHVNNVQAFEKLLGICTGYGGSYNPGNQNLRVENLSDLLMQARAKLLQVSVAKTNYENAQNGRERSFADLRSIASRILAELKSSGTWTQTEDDAATMIRRIRGHASSKPTTTATDGTASSPEPVKRKHSNADIGNTMANFEKLIQTLQLEPKYQPAQPELKVAALQETLKQLRIVNAEVIAASANWGEARRERNRFLYEGRGSLHATAMAVKQQVKAFFGYSSEATASVRKIRFTKSYS